MTPERIKALRDPLLLRQSLLDECLDEIDTLQRDVAIYRDRDEKIVGRMMMERDFAREEANKLRTELAAENQRASALDTTCGELQKELAALKSCTDCGCEIESATCYECHTEEHEKYVKGLEQTIKERDAELTRLKTPPRCPKCWNPEVEVMLDSNLKYYMSCCPSGCCWEESGFNTLDSALNAWRKG